MALSMKGLAREEELVSLLSDMVRIESVNTLFGKGGSDEKNMVEYICRWFDQYEIPYVLQETVLPGRFNVLAHIKGSGAGALCFEAHTDTVSVDEMTIDPFDPVVKDGKLYGRGSEDDKGSVAVMMYVLKLLKEHNITPQCDIYFCAAADEEFSYKGVLRLLEDKIPFDAAIVGEGTSCHIVRACMGNVRFKIITRGVQAHSSHPWYGRNAIVAMGDVIHELKEKLLPMYEQRKHPILGSPTFVMSVIKGGKQVNFVPEYCEMQVDRRTLPGETFEDVRKEVEDCLKELLERNPEYVVEIQEPFASDYSMEVPEEAQIVRAAAAACDAILGSHEIEGGHYSCDATKFPLAGIPAIVMGPGNIRKAHTNDEYVEIADLVNLAEVFAQICVDFRPEK